MVVGFTTTYVISPSITEILLKGVLNTTTRLTLSKVPVYKRTLSTYTGKMCLIIPKDWKAKLINIFLSIKPGNSQNSVMSNKSFKAHTQKYQRIRNKV